MKIEAVEKKTKSLKKKQRAKWVSKTQNELANRRKIDFINQNTLKHPPQYIYQKTR